MTIHTLRDDIPATLLGLIAATLFPLTAAADTGAGNAPTASGTTLRLCAATDAGPQQGSADHPPGYVQPVPDEIIQLWPGDAPGFVPDGRKETVVNERFRDVSVPQLFVYLPPKDKARGTALIIGAGGGYVHLAMCLHVDNVVHLLHDRGIAVFGLKYRTQYGTNDVIEDALADGRQAVRIVRSRAAQWGLDPQRIGVQGYSAGGNLCLNLACRYDPGDPDSPDPLLRLSSRPDFVALMCPWPHTQSLEDFSFDRNTPPMFIASAQDDTIASPAFALAIDARLKRLGIPERTLLPETGGHGAFHCGLVDGPGADWPDLLVAWLREIGMLE